MIYVALLRGINVGGSNKVEMARLKVTFEELGHINVKTYINSGNVIFQSDITDFKALTQKIEAAIQKDFNLSIRIVLRSLDQVQATVKAMPDSWQNNQEMKCDVMFLWAEVDNKNVLKDLTIKLDHDEVKYIPGSIIWRVDKANVNKSGLLKIVGTPFYKQVTIRNSNTVRKLLALMQG
jgi:uncharacterized protein (DUF1697 family)